MDKKSFEELLESVKQGAAILNGEMKAGEIVTYDIPDIKRIRSKFKMSQNKFADALGISAGTLKNWEQGLRYPEGPARILLAVADKHHEAVLDTVLSLKEQKNNSKTGKRKARKMNSNL